MITWFYTIIFKSIIIIDLYDTFACTSGLFSEIKIPATSINAIRKEILSSDNIFEQKYIRCIAAVFAIVLPSLSISWQFITYRSY